MSFLRSVCQVAPAHLLLTGALLHAQLSRSSVEASGGVSPAAAPELDASSLAASVTSVAAKPHTLASMARQLEPVVEVLTNLLKQYQVSGNHNGEANTLCALGNAYNSLGQQEKAIDEFQQALAIYRGSGDTNGEASTLSHLGDVYQGWGFPDMAVRFYRRALQTADKATRALVLNNLGVTYLSLSNKKKALDYLNQARAAYNLMGDKHAAILDLINIGAGENFLAHDPQKAIGLFQEAIAELEPFNDRANEADAYELLGVVWAGLHKQKTAEMNFQRALEIYRETQNAKGEASVLKHLRNLRSREDIALVR